MRSTDRAQPSRSGEQRYFTLDAWRGIAALSVVLFHSSNHPALAASVIGRWLQWGWIGVFVFFPISGYCITGASARPGFTHPLTFFRRRCRRILLPYWAGIVWTVAIGLVALSFNGGTLDDLTQSAAVWASVLSLTQVFTGHPHAINPVYWSLAYELQFYVVAALLMFFPSRARWPFVLAVTGASVVFLWQGSPVEGLFLSYWPCFAAGCATHIWLRQPSDRPYAIAIAAAVMAAALVAPATWLSLGAAALFVVLAPYDATLTRHRATTVLIAVGALSYSLYLTHVPIAGRIVNLMLRFDAPAWVAVVSAAMASLAAGYLFYVAVERRYCRARRADDAVPMTVSALPRLGMS